MIFLSASRRHGTIQQGRGKGTLGIGQACTRVASTIFELVTMDWSEKVFFWNRCRSIGRWDQWDSAGAWGGIPIS